MGGRLDYEKVDPRRAYSMRTDLPSW